MNPLSMDSDERRLKTSIPGGRFDVTVNRYDAGQFPIALGVVDAVAGDEYVADGETDKVEGDLGLAATGLVNQRAGEDALHAPALQKSPGVGQGIARVHDVVDKQDHAPLQIGGDVGQKMHLAHADLA